MRGVKNFWDGEKVEFWQIEGLEFESASIFRKLEEAKNDKLL